MRRMTLNLLEYGLWTLIVIVALVLEVLPVFLVVMIFSLAVGVPSGPALLLIPVVLIAMIVVACIIATRVTRRTGTGPRAGGWRPGERSGECLTTFTAVSGRPLSPPARYHDLKRLR